MHCPSLPCPVESHVVPRDNVFERALKTWRGGRQPTRHPILFFLLFELLYSDTEINDHDYDWLNYEEISRKIVFKKLKRLLG